MEAHYKKFCPRKSDNSQRSSTKILTSLHLPSISLQISSPNNIFTNTRNYPVKIDHSKTLNSKKIHSNKLGNLKLETMEIKEIIGENIEELMLESDFAKKKKSVSSKINQILLIQDQDLNKVFREIKIKSTEIRELIDEYECKNSSELIQILYNEAKISELHRKHLKNLIFTLNLKNKFCEENESFSKNFIGLIKKLELEIKKQKSEIIDLEKKINTNLNLNTLKIDSQLNFEILKPIDFGSSFNFDVDERLDLSVLKKIKPVGSNSRKFYDETIKTTADPTPADSVCIQTKKSNYLKVENFDGRTMSSYFKSARKEKKDIDPFINHLNLIKSDLVNLKEYSDCGVRCQKIAEGDLNFCEISKEIQGLLLHFQEKLSHNNQRK